MSKNISAYESFTASAIKARASVPEQSDMTVNGTVVYCNNIKISKIHNVLGISSTNLSNLCSASNPWSGFGCYEFYVSNFQLLHRLKTPYSLGNFAGYNHSANSPSWNSKPAEEIWINPTQAVIFTADIDVGEINYSNINNCLGAALTIWNGSNLVGYQILDVEDSMFGAICSLECQLTGVTTQTTFTGKVYLTDNTVNFLENLGNALCPIPNIDNFTSTVKVYVNTTLNTSGCAGWTVTNAGINLANSTVSFNNMSIGNDYTDITIQVRLVKQYDNSVETTVFYQGAYVANTSIGSMSNVIHSSLPIPNYGYTAYLEVIEDV